VYNSLVPNDLAASEPVPAEDPALGAQVTRLLNSAAAGDPTASNELYGLIYEQLRAIAHKRMASERGDHTLQTTALVNEACIRLLGTPNAAWNGRGHFFAAAARAMRQILIDHFRSRNADKRGGGRAALSITSVIDLAETTDPAGFLALDDAILRLEREHVLAASVVRLRFFAGLQPAEVAEALGISERTARREWVFARGWLRDALERELE
jgi:RNA polymerase sigma factor (TIGR02999 family)